MGVLKKRTFDCINVDIDKDSITYVRKVLRLLYHICNVHISGKKNKQNKCLKIFQNF